MTDPDIHFHPFPRLPTELRLKIWSLALASTRRTVEVTCAKGIQPGNTRYVKSFASTTQVPTLMRVNREARYEALSIYKPYFKTKHRPTGIYVAFDRDTIVFPEGVISYLQENELQGIQSMVLEMRDYAYFGHFNMDILRGMRELSKLELRVAKGGESRWDGGDFMSILVNDFRDAEEMHPEWQMPYIKIVSKHTGAATTFYGKRTRVNNEVDETR